MRSGALGDAQVGFIFTDFYTLPGFEYTTLEAHDAVVAAGGMSQILLWTGASAAPSFAPLPERVSAGRTPRTDPGRETGPGMIERQTAVGSDKKLKCAAL